jgi:D-arabinose 1-dehydrogenase-like Zn-dependent alcohol dehydrogenase
MYGAGDVRIENVPDARIVEASDALVRVTRACVCGSDLWPYNQMGHSESGQRMGHEFIGVVEEVGADVRTVKAGDVVVAPFAWSDGTCVFCQDGLQTSCLHGGWWARDGIDGGQGEAVRVPQADGTLVVLPVGPDDALMPSLLTLSDVMGTGHHAALAAKIGPGKTAAVVGDGAVGLCGVIAAKRLGAKQIIILGRHRDRIALAKEFGATDVVSERGSPGASARSQSSSASATTSRWSPRSASRVQAAQLDESACRSTSRFQRRCRRSSTTSPSAAARPRPVRTSSWSRGASLVPAADRRPSGVQRHTNMHHPRAHGGAAGDRRLSTRGRVPTPTSGRPPVSRSTTS